MAYNLSKEKMIEHLKENAVYFPFEQIRSYKFLKSQEKQLPIDNTLAQDYFSFFKDVKEQCEILLKAEPQHADADLWKEAIDEINKIIN